MSKNFRMSLQNAMVALIFLSFASCVAPPDFSDIPEIEFVRWEQDTMIQNVGSTIGVLRFTDGDGDIGSDSDTLFFIKDLRTGGEDGSVKNLPMIPEAGANNGVSGEIRFTLFSSCCLPPLDLGFPCSPTPNFPIDTVLYEIYIADRAGNESNHVFTDTIFLLCQ